MVPLLVALLASSTAGPLAGIPRVTIVRYDVRGDDWEAIGRSIAAHGMGQASGLEVAARTSWRAHWRATSLVTGTNCRIVDAAVDYSIIVTLPRLANEATADPALRARWRTYLAALETHEAGHARYAARHVDDIRKAVLGSDCADAKQNGQAVIDAINRWEIRYDRLTHHGATQSEAPPIE